MLKVHFLNVGHGECTIIKHPSGRLTMVDINNSQEYDRTSFAEFAEEQRLWHPRPATLIGQVFYDEGMRERAKNELTDPVEFLKRNYPGERLWRFVLTHPDMDHMRGLARLHSEIGILNFWDTRHTKGAPSFRTAADYTDWAFYQQLRSGGTYTLVHTFNRYDQYFAFGLDEYNQPGGDGIEILSPTPALVTHCNQNGISNDLSYVLRVHHAGESVLLTGDIESVAWCDLVNTYGIALKSSVMAASHHGRDTGYHSDAMKLIRPGAVIVSVGRKPSTDASRKYCADCSSVLSTRYYGDITVTIEDSGQIYWNAVRNQHAA